MTMNISLTLGLKRYAKGKGTQEPPAPAAQSSSPLPSEAGRLNFFTAAKHARVIGSQNPPGLFVRIVRSGLWKFLTQDDEDVARVQIRRVLYPEAATPVSARDAAPRASTATYSFRSDSG